MNRQRRQLLLTLGATAAAFGGLRHALARAATGSGGFASLRPDPDHVLDLPAGFTARVISRAGEAMSDGWQVPAMADGMACFRGEEGRWILVRNHELDASPGDVASGPFAAAPIQDERLGRLYDPGKKAPPAGGTTTLVYNPTTRSVERQWLSLAGTARNCAGGPTPWNSWLSCEESVVGIGNGYTREHGYVFEVPSSAEELTPARPLKAMGRFNHEAAAVDPGTGIVYLTEDRPDGLFYRFLPSARGRLSEGGTLQALAVEGVTDTRNWLREDIPPGDLRTARWIDLDGVDSPGDDLRKQGHDKGAALFARGEGLWWGRGEGYFCCTSGGKRGAGQIFRYRPSAFEGGAEEARQPGQLELFVESNDPSRLDQCDNITVTPWGDLLVCEDTRSHCGLVGVTPDGEIYPFADNPYNGSELAGAC